MDTEVLRYVRQHPGLIGIDIDENTVLVLHGSQAEVFGDGTVASSILHARPQRRGSGSGTESGPT